MLPILISAAAGTAEAGGGQLTLPEMEVNANMEAIWTSITTVISSFLTNVLTPVTTFVTGNPITLIFLGISFVGIGIRYLKRVSYAFGRGR